MRTIQVESCWACPFGKDHYCKGEIRLCSLLGDAWAALGRTDQHIPDWCPLRKGVLVQLIGQKPVEVGQLLVLEDVLLRHLSPDLQTEPAQR